MFKILKEKLNSYLEAKRLSSYIKMITASREAIREFRTNLKPVGG